MKQIKYLDHDRKVKKGTLIDELKDDKIKIFCKRDQQQKIITKDMLIEKKTTLTPGEIEYRGVKFKISDHAKQRLFERFGRNKGNYTDYLQKAVTRDDIRYPNEKSCNLHQVLNYGEIGTVLISPSMNIVVILLEDRKLIKTVYTWNSSKFKVMGL